MTINGKKYRRFIHGTTEEAAQKLIRDRQFYRHDIDTVWTCSEPRYLYCREIESSTLDEQEMADDDREAVCLCLENAQIAAAYTDSKSSTLALVSIYIPEEIADDIAEVDWSCENMEDCFQLDKEEIDKYIKDEENPVYIEINYCRDGYIPYLRPFYLSNLSSDYMYIKDDMLAQAVKVLHKSDVFIEDLLYTGELEENSEFSTLPVTMEMSA